MQLSWLDTHPLINTGLTFGLPWEKGKVKESEMLFKLGDKTIQSWPTAYWPDGSVKWTGHAAVLSEGADTKLDFLNEKSEQTIKDDGIQVHHHEDHIIIDNGKYEYVINKKGPYIIEEIRDVNQSILAEKLELVASIKKEQREENQTIIRNTSYSSTNQTISVELEGKDYTTIKIDGEIGTDRLPFTVRLKVFKGSDELKLVSTQFYNINEETEFISSLGLKFKSSFKGKPYNKHVKLITEKGVYNEPAQLLSSRRHRFTNYYEQQIAGNKIEVNEESHAIIDEAKKNAIWNNFKFNQVAHGSGKYAKRTHSNQSWLTIPTVNHSNGMMHVTNQDFGVSFGLRYFNEKYPSQLSVSDLEKEKATLTVWFWSPDGEAMDLRHYDNETHVESAYEGFPEMRATPEGIANTSEVTLKFYKESPTDEELVHDAKILQNPPLLIADSEYYYKTNATGEWPLINREDEKTKEIEDQLEHIIDFYLKESKQRQWTGYWNYGDVMHSYDSVRSQWFYDQGGYAWQNTELVPNLWLWYSFFRTKESRIFRFVEAMTKHNSEVDRYHFGEYKGLGSRHNVSHWGCGCKEARISMACLYKYYYYLTADERTKELLDDTKDADKTLNHLDPMREFFGKPEDEHVTHARSGPDWSAFLSNWLSQWERNQDDTYLNKINTGLNNLKEAPHRLLSGPTFEYNTETSEMNYLGTGIAGGYHMIISFGAPQVWIETANLLEDKEFKEMIAEFGKVYAMSDEEKRQFSDGKLNNEHFHWPMFASGLMAYAANHYEDEALAEQAWENLLEPTISGVELPIEITSKNNWSIVEEIPWMTTNVASQWSLNIMMALKYIHTSLK